MPRFGRCEITTCPYQHAGWGRHRGDRGLTCWSPWEGSPSERASAAASMTGGGFLRSAAEADPEAHFSALSVSPEVSSLIWAGTGDTESFSFVVLIDVKWYQGNLVFRKEACLL